MQIPGIPYVSQILCDMNFNMRSLSCSNFNLRYKHMYNIFVYLMQFFINEMLIAKFVQDQWVPECTSNW